MECKRRLSVPDRTTVAPKSHLKGGITMPSKTASRTVLTAFAAVTMCSLAFTISVAGGVTSAAGPGSIGVAVRLGPTVTAMPAIRLLQNATSDLWASHCVIDASGQSACNGLPPGSYTFEIVGAPVGVVLTPQCVPSTSGTFYPIEIGTTSDWATDVWRCDLYIAEPGVVVSGPADQLPALTVDLGSPNCVDMPGLVPGDGTAQRWCSSPSPATWTITRPSTAPAGSTMFPWCRAVGSYVNYGNYEYVAGPLAVTSALPQWDCWVSYAVTGLTWRVADTAPDGPIVASSAWRLTDTGTGIDRSPICTPVEPDPGILVAYTCPLPLGEYELVFDDPTAAQLSGCRTFSLSQFTPQLTCDILMPDTSSTEPIGTTASTTPIATELPATGRTSTPGSLLAACLLAVGLVLTGLARRHPTA